MEHFPVRGAQLDRCPVCAGLWFDAMELQAVLGRQLNVEKTQTESTRSCPACRVMTTQAQLDGVAADFCHQCAGVFLEDREFQKLAADTIAPTRKKKAPARRCPGCGSAMQVFRVGEVEIDKCFFCGGLFLNDGELEQVLGRRLTATAGSSAGRDCSSCQTNMVHSRVERVEMDHCPDCGGVYLDLGELDLLAGKRVRVTQKEVSILDPDATTYDCYGCGERGLMSKAYLTRKGMCCGSCYPIIDCQVVVPDPWTGRTSFADTDAYDLTLIRSPHTASSPRGVPGLLFAPVLGLLKLLGVS